MLYYKEIRSYLFNYFLATQLCATCIADNYTYVYVYVAMTCLAMMLDYTTYACMHVCN